MKIWTLIIIPILFGSIKISGQPTLDQPGILPQLSDSFYYYMSTPSIINDTSGANVTWHLNYTYSLSNTKYYSYHSTVNTPFYSTCPGADYCEITGSLISNGYNTYSYRYLSGNILSEKENISILNGDTLSGFYYNNSNVFQFPINYQDSVYDTFEGVSYQTGRDTVSRHGASYYISDGYGTLIYSTGDTIFDVMRLYSFIYYVDSLPDSYDSTYIILKSWYVNGIHAPLIFDITNGFWQHTYSTSQDYSFSGSRQWNLDTSFVQSLVMTTSPYITEKKINAYPNPSSGKIYFSNLELKSKVTITNISGGIVYQSNSLYPSDQIEIKNPGFYFITIKTAKNIYKEKILIVN